VAEDESVLEIPDQAEGRVQFDFIISPVESELRPHHGVEIRYWNLFRVGIAAVYPAPPVNPEWADAHFVALAPSAGCFEKAALNEDEALCRFHQKLNERPRALLLYPPNRSGMWRIIPAVPMLFPPLLTIEFHDPDLEAVPWAGAKHGNVDIRFRVRSKKHGHYIPEAPPIRSITLEAAL
jgi:hypothetical protein